MDLKQKGENAQIGAFKQLKVSLIWTSAVDLDLMAFYRTKDNNIGGVYSDNYAGGSLGDLNQFPFIQLSGDEGVGAVGGDNREELRIAKLDDLEELYICAFNFTDASTGSNKVFADYDARIEVVTDKGDSHEVALDSSSPGSVAVIAKFKTGFMGSELINSSEVMSFDAFKTNIPGADQIKLSSKITLAQKGDQTSLSGNDFQATLRWRAAVDLDLYCFYRLKSENAASEKKGFLGKLKTAVSKDSSTTAGKVFFGSRGSKTSSPWIYLDQDAGIGDKGGDNEENIYFTNLEKIEQAIIVANIYNKPNSNFASYDGEVEVKCGTNQITVPLTENKPGNWCVVAHIDNTSGSPKLININETQQNEPSIR